MMTATRGCEESDCSPASSPSQLWPPWPSICTCLPLTQPTFYVCVRCSNSLLSFLLQYSLLATRPPSPFHPYIFPSAERFSFSASCCIISILILPSLFFTQVPRSFFFYNVFAIHTAVPWTLRTLSFGNARPATLLSTH